MESSVPGAHNLLKDGGRKQELLLDTSESGVRLRSLGQMHSTRDLYVHSPCEDMCHKEW